MDEIDWSVKGFGLCRLAGANLGGRVWCHVTVVV